MSEVESKVGLGKFYAAFPIKDIDTNGNIRADMGDISELAESIKTEGVLQPVLIRRDGNKFVIVAGHRRVLAAKKAGLKEIPAIVGNVVVEEVPYIQATENIQRKNLNAMEEARCIIALMNKGQTLEEIARKLGKNVKYTKRAVMLLDLPESMQEAIEAGKLSAEHGYQILRVPPERWPELVKQVMRVGQDGLYPSANDISRAIMTYNASRNLTKAIFPKDVAFAGKVACVECPYNSGNQGMLFAGAKKGTCTGVSCYTEKVEAHYRDFADKVQSMTKLKFVGVVRAEGYSEPSTTFKGYVMLAHSNAPDVRKLFNSNPEKFGEVVALPSKHHFEEPPRRILCVEQAFLSKSLPTSSAKRLGEQTVNGEKESVERRRQQFIESQVTLFYIEAAAKAAIKKDVEKGLWRMMVENLNPTYNTRRSWFSILGLPASTKKVDAKTMDGLSLEQLKSLGAMLACDQYNTGSMVYLKLDVNKIRKEAAAKAVELWKEKQQGKKTNGKK